MEMRIDVKKTRVQTEDDIQGYSVHFPEMHNRFTLLPVSSELNECALKYLTSRNDEVEQMDERQMLV